jgi:outer membrane protein OmpA-like peptidoglycan-associated protein/opacity protein-like surface antigen
MRWAVRFIAMIAIILAMLPALRADDAPNAKGKAKVDKATSTTATPATNGADQPPTPGRPALATKAVVAKPSTKPQAGVTSQTGAATHKHRSGANTTPKVEWFLGYSFWRAMPTAPSNRMGYLHGGSTSLAYNFNRYVGLAVDFGGFDNTKLTLLSPNGSRTVNANGSAYTYMLGPRFSYRKYERFTPFVQALFGEAHASPVTISGCTGDPACTPLASDNAFATMLGAGFDIKVSRHIALRLFEGDFLLTHFENPFSTGGQERGWQKNARFSSGIVFRFGGNPPPPPREPVAASCSADKESVYEGSGDFIVVRAQVSNPDNNTVNYSWSASEGTVDGNGPEVRWNSSDRRPGTYTITARVDNGRNGTANCSASVRVEPRPNRPPTISCSADHHSVTVGTSVDITSTANDPDNDPLKFAWSATGGKVEGSGANVRYQTEGVGPGSYTITGHVDDGRGGTAECTVSVDVQAAEPPAEVKELETKLALHSIYFPTARPTESNPTGGLVESQQKVLVSLAADFNRYLTYKPQAHLILEGHADRRGSESYNKELTDRRVEATKSFLVERGVPAASIQTQSFGKQDNLSAEQVKQLVDQNPDLNDEERQRIEGNLLVIVMANNRRVDVSIDTNGQQSVRRYPFNAKDSLTLLSTGGSETGRQTKPSTEKKSTKP